MKRHPKNPIITRKDVPEIYPQLVDVTSVLNPGAVKFNDKFHLMLRVQNRGRETFFMLAESTDGINFKIRKKIIEFKGIEKIQKKIFHIYDARITEIEDKYYIMFAMDMEQGCFLGLAETRDFEFFEFLGIVSTDDNRNGVLFPEKINGRYIRLDRPNKFEIESGQTTGTTIVLSESEDLLNWNPVEKVISGRFHYWDELIGAGPPPVKTRQGWLQVYHGVATHLASIFIYQAGVMLLDLKNPARVIGRCPYNILEPREIYELTGQVPNVVFPSGMIIEKYDSEVFAEPNSRVFIYYGAADTSVCLATTTINELINFAKMGK